MRKLFEKKSTDFGKIEKIENKSGAPATNRTPREERVMATFEFLGGHIVHGNTLTTDNFLIIKNFIIKILNNNISLRLTFEKHGDSCSEMSHLSGGSMV